MTDSMQGLSETHAALDGQRSHVLLVLARPKEGQDEPFEAWFTGPCRDAMASHPEVLSVRHYRQAEIDITGGRHEPIPYGYLGVYELVLDGGTEAEPLLRGIAALHAGSLCAQPPATWLYYPASEKVGRSTPDAPWLTIAYANPIAGTELAFREFYSSRHLRHALNIPALVSGQCLERAQHQRAGSMQPLFQTIALYEQVAAPQAKPSVRQT